MIGSKTFFNILKSKTMYIVACTGEVLQITNLKKAITQAKNFKGYRIDDPSYKALNDYLHSYWEDIYKKLLALRLASL